MNTCIKKIVIRINESPKLKQWLWFIALWLGGLCTVMLLTYPIKLLIILDSQNRNPSHMTIPEPLVQKTLRLKLKKCILDINES
jgi:hypothetical protein